ncbi:MAG: lipid biosynthesis B12-binding/radical SAM protein [Candidatus Omnitrophota bacterium]
MKSVLLISPNQEKIPYPVAPIGLLYIADALKKALFKVSLLDLCFSENIRRDIETRIRRSKPDYIGISLRNVDNLTFPKSISYLPAFKGIVRTIRRCTGAPIVLGGSAFSLFPREILSFLECEWGVAGEGEEAFVELLNVFRDDTAAYGKIDNLAWKKKGEILLNRVRHMSSSSEYAPDYGLIDNALYMKRGGMANLQTKRGCRFRCSYCTYPSIEGKTYRLRPPEAVAADMSLLQRKYAVSHVFFVDDVFTYPAAHASAVCEALIKKGTRMRWSCFASPSGISGTLLAQMKKAGCTHIEFGSDSLSDRVLTKMRKPFLSDDILRAGRLCKEAGIKCAHYIIFGAPGENRVTLKEQFRAIRVLEGDAVIAMIGIRIYPGTQLQKVSLREKIIKSGDDLLSPRFYLSPEISQRELLERVARFTRSAAQCIVPGLEIRSSEKMYSVLRAHYQEGPLWGYLG